MIMIYNFLYDSGYNITVGSIVMHCILFLARKQAVRFEVCLHTVRIPVHIWEIDY